MKTDNVPALVMLSAGFVDCVIAIKTHQTLWTFTRQLLLVLVIFLILGSIIKMVLDRNLKEMDDLEDVDLGEPVEGEQREAQGEQEESPEETEEVDEQSETQEQND